MRILHVDMPLESVAGRLAEKRTLEVCREMVKAGVPSSVLTTSQVMPEYVRRLEGTTVTVFIGFALDGVYYSKAMRRKQLEQIINPFDLVHIANHWNYLNALVIHTCIRSQKPYVICPGGDMAGNLEGSRCRLFFNAMVGKNQIRQAAGHVAVSKEDFAWFKEYGVRADDITLIPNGVNLDDFKISGDERFRKRLELGSAPFIFFVGQLCDANGPDRLLDAYLGGVRGKKLARYHLVFVGADGGLEEKLKKKAELSGYGAKIHFLGSLYREDLIQAYHAANLLVIPARGQSRPVEVLEAGVCATPVLMTSDCDFSDLVKAGGAEVTRASVNGIQEGLLSMCHEWARLKGMGRKLQRYVLGHYTWDAVAEHYIELYEKILGKL